MNRRLLLRDALAHGANGGLNIIVGSPSVQLPDVVVEFSEERLPRHASGSMAVLTIHPPAESWRQDALIRRVRDRGFSSLSMPGAGSFGEGSRILATRLGLVLLDVERPMELARACWQLLEGRDSLTLTYVRRASRSFEYRAENLSDLIAHLASNVGQGVGLVSARDVVVQSGGTLPAELLAAINFSPWLDTVSTDDGSVASVRVDSPGRTGLRLAIFGPRCSDVQLGALAVAAEVMMPAVAARILIDEVTDVNDAAADSGLLGDFLEKRPVPDVELEQRMIDRGWRISGYHLGFRMVGRTRVDAYQLLRHLKQGLAGIAVESFAAVAGRGVSGWLNFSEPLTPPEVEAQVSMVRGIHSGLRRSFDISTGIGTVASGPVGLAETIAGASEAARIAANRSASGWFVRMDALGIEQLLLSWTESDTFIPAAQSLLAPLQGSAAELIATLSSYLDNESSIKGTAASMGLHRNTVAARINKAQELLGLDLDDPETRLALHLACRAIAQ